MIGEELKDYKRTGAGGKSSNDFLKAYYNSSTGRWNYPKNHGNHGFELNDRGVPIFRVETLKKDELVDRYGGDNGRYLSPIGTPYKKRSLPPESLDNASDHTCNYYQYKVINEFQVEVGRSAPEFDQDGLGYQYYLYDTPPKIPNGPNCNNTVDYNNPPEPARVRDLLARHYLVEVKPK
jgi:hypothetical protein